MKPCDCPNETVHATSRCETRIWLALAAADGWLKAGEISCASGAAYQTVDRVMARLVAAGLAERVRVGISYYYRLADPESAASVAHAERVALACRVLGIEGARPCKEKRRAS